MKHFIPGIHVSLFLLAALDISGFASAQLVTPSVINSAGTSGVAENIYFEFNLGETLSNTISGDHIITQGLLQPLNGQGPLPVAGLNFFARRLNASAVELTWSTEQEINNAGFYIERKKENEADFTTIAMVASKAANGNSTLPLQYVYNDLNAYAGKIFYRLRQKDIDGQETFSNIRIVNRTNNIQPSLKVWPVPAIDKVNVLVKSIESPQVLSVLDMQGRVIKKYQVQNEQTIVITGLIKGAYILRLNTGLSSIAEKIVVQ